MATERVTATGIRTFLSKITSTGGISASNLYSLNFQPSVELKKFISDQVKFDMLNEKLTLVCNEIQLPGVTYAATDVKSVHKGVIQKIAGTKVYNELDVSFFMDADSRALQVFRAWQDFITGARVIDSKNIYATFQSGTEDGRYSAFAQQYYDTYACELDIKKLEKYTTGNIPKAVTKKRKEQLEEGQDAQTDKPTARPSYVEAWEARLYKAYPYTISSIPYSAGQAQLVKVSVGFYYEYSQLKIPSKSNVINN